MGQDKEIEENINEIVQVQLHKKVEKTMQLLLVEEFLDVEELDLQENFPNVIKVDTNILNALRT